MIIKNIHAILFSSELTCFKNTLVTLDLASQILCHYLCLIIDFQLGSPCSMTYCLHRPSQNIFGVHEKKDCIPLQRIIVLQIVAIYSTKIYRKKYRLAEFCSKLNTVFVQISHLILYTIHLNIANYGKIELHQQIQLLPLLRF